MRETSSRERAAHPACLRAAVAHRSAAISRLNGYRNPGARFPRQESEPGLCLGHKGLKRWLTMRPEMEESLVMVRGLLPLAQPFVQLALPEL